MSVRLQKKNTQSPNKRLHRSIWQSLKPTNYHVVCCVQCRRKISLLVTCELLHGPRTRTSILVLRQRKPYKLNIVGNPRLFKQKRREKEQPKKLRKKHNKQRPYREKLLNRT